ncbi:MAG: gamma-glutamyltransferase [Candidatus Binatia bacterium]
MRWVGPGVLFLVTVVVPAAHAAPRHGAVAAEHQLAANAGAEILRAGGTAVDAAIATAAAVCIVHPASCGVGGGGFALVRTANGTERALDFRECAPAAATAGRYLQDGTPVPERTRTGGLAVAVPGEVAGWVALHDHGGRLPLARVLAPAVRLARDGFPLAATPHLRREIERNTELLAADPGLRAVFLAPDGTTPGPDFRLVQAELARTLEAVGREGTRGFYAGARAAAIARTVAARGGVLTVRDLSAYRPLWRRPLVAGFRGRRIVTFPPPGSGGIVLEVLALLAGDDLAAGTPATFHLIASALAQGFADRARWYGDPTFTPIPLDRLLAPHRLRALRARWSADHVVEPTAELRADHGTTHVSVVDAEGNAVALTTTINTAFGAGILVPGTGIILNNEMDDFAVAPGQANVYGLTGTAANAIAAGKRPQSSMSPTIVLRGRRPELVVGGSGGPLIVSGVVQTVLGVTAFGRDVRAAVAAPRVHDQGAPPALAVEPAVPADVREALGRMGHQVREIPAVAAVAATGLATHGRPVAAGDRRKDGGEAVVP